MFFPPLNVISRLILSKSAGPKVIIISSFHYICSNFCFYWLLFNCLMHKAIPIMANSGSSDTLNDTSILKTVYNN